MSMNYFEQADKQLVKAIQKETDAVVDGFFGHQALFNLFLKICDFDEYSPVATELYNGYLIMARKDQVHFAMPRNSKSVSNYEYAVSGTFQDESKNKLVSILADSGKFFRATGSKAWRGKGEGTIYMTKSGEIKWERFQYMPTKDVEWAISGVTVHDYHPVWEGFSGDFADVLRPTKHVLFGVTQDDKIVVFLKNCSMGTLKNISDNVLKLKYSISLDGGHIPAIKSPKFRFNSQQKQNNLIYFE